jgi:predicted TIM-barrel fold metal-dependent hydrolase
MRSATVSVIAVCMVLLLVTAGCSKMGTPARTATGSTPELPDALGVGEVEQSEARAPERRGAVQYRVADAHLHYVDFLQKTEGMPALLAAMDNAGVDHAMISGMPLVKKWHAAEPRRPGYYLEDDSRTYWYSATDVLVAHAIEQLPEDQRRRFHPSISGFNGTDRNAVDHVRRMLELYPDLWEGIGEVMTRHDDLTALTYGETARADHVALDAVYELAAERDLPVFVHSNIGSVWLREPIYLHEMENALKRHPRTRFIWCHAGISRRIDVPNLPKELRRLLSTYDHLWIGLSWVVRDYIIREGKSNQAWIDLVEEFPDRFMIGSDAVGRFAGLPATIQSYYVSLEALGPETRAKVAHDNFLSVLPQRVQTDLAKDADQTSNAAHR